MAGDAGALILTPGALFTENGTEVAALGRIASVDRGAFAFKPSNGFVLRMTSAMGVTASVEARAMADILAAMLADRDQAS